MNQASTTAPAAPNAPPDALAAHRTRRARLALLGLLGPLLGLLLAGLAGPAAAQAPSVRQPRVQEVLPAPGEVVDERAVFALKLGRGLAAPPRALCDVWGIRSAVPVELVTGTARSAALKALDVPEAERGAGSPWVALRCQTRLPDGGAVSLRWLSPEAGPPDAPSAGAATFDGQRFDYTVKSAWPVAVVCTRSNLRTGCNPLETVRLAFTQPVQLADLQRLRLKAPDGKLIAPKPVPPEAVQDGSASQLSFTGLAAHQAYTVQWPPLLADAQGRDLLGSATRREPLVVHMGPYPPLAKFGANFGIAEKAIGGVVPLTVRAVDGVAGAPRARLRSVRITDEAGIVEALRQLQRIQAADDAAGGWYATDAEAPEPEPEPAADTPGTRAGGSAADAGTTGRGADGPRRAARPQPRFPFTWPRAHGQPVDTRSTPWLQALRGSRVQDLPRPLGGEAFEVLGLPLQGSGLHLLEVDSPALGRALLDGRDRMYVRAGALVTDLGVHLHWSERTAAVWVTRLSTGQPVAEAPVSIVNCTGRRIAQGRTNAQGWVNLPGAGARDTWQCPLYAFARDPAPASDDLGLASTEWQRGIESWRFETLAGLWAPTGPQIVHAVLARNLLRPGETLHARLHWRRVDDAGRLVAPRAADLPRSLSLVHQGSGERIPAPVTWDARGQADLVLKLPEGAKRGDWVIDAGTVELSGAAFKIADFRLPVLKAEVLGPTTPQTGPTVPLTLRMQYLSGGPAMGEPVRLSQRLVPTTPRFEAHAGYSFGDDEPAADGPEPAPTMQAANQPLPADQPLKLGDDGTRQVSTQLARPITAPRLLVTEMEYRDPNGETYRAQGRTTLWPAAVAVGLKLDHWASGTQRSAELLVVDAQGRPQAGVPVTVQGGMDGWVVHRRRTTGGFYSYATERRPYEPKPLCQGTSGADGRFTCRFDAALGGDLDSGEFTLVAEARDREGRASRTRGSLWLYSGGEVWFAQADHDRMDVLAEQRRYAPGDTATLQVRSPFREATAWVNVMRGGTVVDTLVLPLTGQQPTIRLPIKASYAPNVFINVLAVRGRVAEPAATALVDLARPAYKLGLAALEVGSDAQVLNVQVRTDRPSYQTRETAQVQLKVSAAMGALPAERSVTVFAIDEALLELMRNDSWQLLAAMTARRGYGFESASAAMQVIGKRHYGRKALPPGGGGGQGNTRELFDTLLLWRSDVTLDANGEARLTVPINDSLTRFRVVAVAEAGGDRFGTGSASFTATRDLQLLAGLPATVRAGDRFDGVFTLRNAGDHPLQATVQAWLNDAPLPPRSVVLAPQATQRLVWPVQVAQVAELRPAAASATPATPATHAASSASAPGHAGTTAGTPADAAAGEPQQRWRVEAQASGPAGLRRDAIAVTQAIGSPLNPQRYTVGHQAVGATPSPIVWPVQPPAGAVAGQGELVVTLKPALASDPGSVRAYMRQYPFFCLEQRVSKAVSLKDERLWRVIHDNLDAYIAADGLLTYYPQQAGTSGGYDVLTAFVLSASQAAGWTLPEEARRRLLDALERFVTGKLERQFDHASDGEHGLTERKLLALEALARHGRARPAMAESLRLGEADWPKLSHRALVQWLDVLQRVDWPRRQALAAPALAELRRRLAADGQGGLRLKPRADEQRWYWMYSEVASQARLALLAQELPALKEQADALALGAVHQQQPGGHWWATQANVWGSLMLALREQQLTRQAGGAVSGRTVLALSAPAAAGGGGVPTTRTITHDWSAQPQGASYRLPGTLIATGPQHSALALQHVGTGRPAVQAHGEAGTALSAPVERGGVVISRQVRPVRQQVPGQWQAGDIAEVRVSFQAPRGTGWLVVSDPLPPGATVLGNGLRGQDAVAEDSGRGHRAADGRWEPAPAYVERSFTHVRAYYETLWGDGPHTLTYQLRLNTSGRFVLPPTQVEAMYDPDRVAFRPNGVWEVR